MEQWIIDYNNQEHARWSELYEMKIDKMSVPINPWTEQTACKAFSLNPNVMNVYVRVINQPHKLTRHVYDIAAGSVPDDYNNIASFYQSQGKWVIKYTNHFF